LVREIRVEARSAEDAARLARPCRSGAERERRLTRGARCRAAAAAAAVLISLAAVSACDREPEAPAPRVKQVFHLNSYEKDFGYAQAVLIDKTLYVSGTVAVDEQGRLVSAGDMAGQLRAVYANIRRTLTANQSSFDEVVKETIYTTDMDGLLKASDLRFEYYDKERLPTSTWVQVQRLVDPGFLVQIEVIAELP
jgi:2-iminobutanoate/2-iminopropanoate deaminase